MAEVEWLPKIDVPEGLKDVPHAYSVQSAVSIYPPEGNFVTENLGLPGLNKPRILRLMGCVKEIGGKGSLNWQRTKDPRPNHRLLCHRCHYFNIGRERATSGCIIDGDVAENVGSRV